MRYFSKYRDGHRTGRDRGKRPRPRSRWRVRSSPFRPECLPVCFSDERGDYPAGTYLRNPPGSAHAPFSREGCVLFVKLWQFAVQDLEPVCLDTRAAPWRQGMVPGLQVMPLHEHEGVSTALVRWAPDTVFNSHRHPGGEEILVLEGLFRDDAGDYPQGTWLRSPRWSQHAPFTGAGGALIYVKVGHLGAEFLAP